MIGKNHPNTTEWWESAGPRDIAESVTLIDMPDFVGMATHYNERVFAYAFRMWEWFEAEGIDPEPYRGEPMRYLREDHGSELLEMALREGWELSVLQANAGQAAGVELAADGWLAFINRRPNMRTVAWSPQLEPYDHGEAEQCEDFREMGILDDVLDDDDGEGGGDPDSEGSD